LLFGILGTSYLECVPVPCPGSLVPLFSFCYKLVVIASPLA
jgi:hypothetical protein